MRSELVMRALVGGIATAAFMLAVASMQDSSTVSELALTKIRGHGQGAKSTSKVNCAQYNVGSGQRTDCANQLKGTVCISCELDPSPQGDKGSMTQANPGYIDSGGMPSDCGRKIVGTCDGNGACVENDPPNVTQCRDLVTLIIQNGQG